MGESASARTERELAQLRSSLDRDLTALGDRVREDVDPRNLFRRQPVAVAGALGSLAVATAVSVVTKLRSAKRRPEHEIDRIIEGLGGRVDKLKGRARKRFREQLRKEVSKVDKPRRGAQEALWGVVAAAAAAAAATLARGFAARLTADEPRPVRPEGPVAEEAREGEVP